MKRIIIIGEGQTEQLFCNDILQPHFSLRSTYLQNPIIKKTRGGIVNWVALKHQVEIHLKQDPTAFVTTLIDYYGIHAHHLYPKWQETKILADKNKALDLIEQAMLNDINPGLQERFTPYIQLHEFEGLLFSDITVFEKNFEDHEILDRAYLTKTINEFDNPELINDGPTTAPSKRLAKIIKGYYSEYENMKVVYGSLLAQDIGLPAIRNKCPHFNEWITKLESL